MDTQPSVYLTVGNPKGFIVAQEKLDALLKPKIKKALKLEPKPDDAAEAARWNCSVTNC